MTDTNTATTTPAATAEEVKTRGLTKRRRTTTPIDGSDATDTLS